MSAHALKAATEQKIGQIINQYAEAIISGHEDDLAKLRLHQGMIEGMRLALGAQSEAYKEMGS